MKPIYKSLKEDPMSAPLTSIVLIHAGTKVRTRNGAEKVINTVADLEDVDVQDVKG